MPKLFKKEIIPLYSRVSSTVQNKILSGQYEPGEKLPTEDELVEYFGVSKITIRNAFGLLESEGLIYRTRGKGTFVAPVIPESKQYIHTSLNKISLTLERSETKSLGIKQIKVWESRTPKDICHFFTISNQDDIGRIRRINIIKRVPYYEEIYLPGEISRHLTQKELIKEKIILKILNKKIGLKISKGEMYLQALPADPDISKILNCQSFDPLIHMQTFYWSAPDKPLGISNAYFRSCYFKYKTTIEVDSLPFNV